MNNTPAENTIQRELDPDADEPAVEFVEMISEIEGEDVENLPSIWERAGDILEHLFSTPPKPEAQMKVEFSYYTYRITVQQDGFVELRKTG